MRIAVLEDIPEEAQLALQVLSDGGHSAVHYQTGKALIDALLKLDGNEIEAALRKHAGENVDAALISIDAKTLRGSLDRFADKAAVQWISAFAGQEKIVLGHVELTGGDKGGEIGAAQELIATLGLTGKLFTFDALHCQKKRSTSSETREMTR
jgi:predicted transposase YbfD/YdcC